MTCPFCRAKMKKVEKGWNCTKCDTRFDGTKGLTQKEINQLAGKFRKAGFE